MATKAKAKTTPATLSEEDFEPAKVSIFDIAETDTDAEENGRWFNDLFDDGNDINVKLRRMTCKKSADVRRRLETQFKSHMDRKKGTYPDHIGEKMINLQMSQAIVADWSNILDRDGTEIECTPENILTLCERLPAFRDLMVGYSMAMENFRIEDVEEAAGN